MRPSRKWIFSSSATANGSISYPRDVRVGVDGLVGEGHRLGIQTCQRFGNFNRAPGNRHDRLGRQIDTGGESPGALADHADAEADRLGFDRRLQLAVAGDDDLIPQTLDAKIGVSGAALLRNGECRVGETIEREREERGIDGARHGTQAVSIRLTFLMNVGELHHLLFRWLHVMAAILWIGHLWSVVFGQQVRAVRPDLLMRAASGATWVTGFALLIFVYYAGGALTTPTQSWGMALGVGLAVILLSWLLYDALWTLLVDRPAIAAVLSILLLGGIAQGLAEFMTGRAVFIHLGALLGSIMVNNTHQRPQRVAHNAVLAPAVVILMISNHFPLIYGDTRAWLVAPIVVFVGCLTGVSFEWMSRRGQRLPAVA